MAALDDVSIALLNALALRADSAGHVLLTPEERRFAHSSGGSHWLQPLDDARSLYKLTNLTQDLGLKVEHPPGPHLQRTSGKAPS